MGPSLILGQPDDVEAEEDAHDVRILFRVSQALALFNLPPGGSLLLLLCARQRNGREMVGFAHVRWAKADTTQAPASKAPSTP